MAAAAVGQHTQPWQTPSQFPRPRFQYSQSQTTAVPELPLPARNETDLTRDMLITILTHLSTLMPSHFNGKPVRLVVHGGACMLLHPILYDLAQNLPSHFLRPVGSSDGGSADSTPIPRRKTTRDVDYINRSFAAEWNFLGITDATQRLQACIRATARQFNLGADWMNSDADIALVWATDNLGNKYDPIYTAALEGENIQRFTIFTSPNSMLTLVSVPPPWAVALKLVRYTKWDPGDICVLLRCGHKYDGHQWTPERLETSLRAKCGSMGYANFDAWRLQDMRARITHAVNSLDQIAAADRDPSLRVMHSTIATGGFAGQTAGPSLQPSLFVQSSTTAGPTPQPAWSSQSTVSGPSNQYNVREWIASNDSVPNVGRRNRHPSPSRAKRHTPKPRPSTPSPENKFVFISPGSDDWVDLGTENLYAGSHPPARANQRPDSTAPFVPPLPRDVEDWLPPIDPPPANHYHRSSTSPPWHPQLDHSRVRSVNEFDRSVSSLLRSGYQGMATHDNDRHSVLNAVIPPPSRRERRRRRARERNRARDQNRRGQGHDSDSDDSDASDTSSSESEGSGDERRDGVVAGWSPSEAALCIYAPSTNMNNPSYSVPSLAEQPSLLLQDSTQESDRADYGPLYDPLPQTIYPAPHPQQNSGLPAMGPTRGASSLDQRPPLAQPPLPRPQTYNQHSHHYRNTSPPNGMPPQHSDRHPPSAHPPLPRPQTYTGKPSQYDNPQPPNPTQESYRPDHPQSVQPPSLPRPQTYLGPSSQYNNSQPTNPTQEPYHLDHRPASAHISSLPRPQAYPGQSSQYNIQPPSPVQESHPPYHRSSSVHPFSLPRPQTYSGQYSQRVVDAPPVNPTPEPPPAHFSSALPRPQTYSGQYM